MKNAKTTRRALLSSVVALVLCLTMLMGTTFAWFTDTAKVAVNTITSGELDITLSIYNEETGKWEEVTKDTVLDFVDLDTNKYWEPGCTYTLPTLRIKNEGNLALKYKVVITGIKGDAKLNEVIDWTYGGFAVDTEYNLAPEDYEDITIKGHMQETADNDYQNEKIEGISITVYATQYTAEYDSTTNKYDAEAKYDDGKEADNVTVTAGTAAELHDILTKALTGGSVDGVITVELEKDFNLADGWTTINGSNYSGVNNVVINGNGHAITNLDQPLLDTTFAGSGTFTVNNLTVKDSVISYEGAVDRGVGVIFCTTDANGAVVFNGCTLEKVNITNTGDDSYLGGFVGYSSAANLKFENCVVNGCTLIGTKDIGALVGYTQAATTVDGCTVTNNTITSSNASTYRVGALAGTVNSNGLAVTDTTVNGNNIAQDNASTAKKHDYVGRILATVTIDGVAIN